MISIASDIEGDRVMTKQLSRIELQTRMQANPNLVLVEALPEKYYLDWHLPGARQLPHDQVKTLAASVVPEKDAEIVVYCASATCRNSHVAASALIALGYRDVAVYPGGKQDWSEAGLPIEHGAAVALA
jgi:rhodanese-related sulfurtransferase